MRSMVLGGFLCALLVAGARGDGERDGIRGPARVAAYKLAVFRPGLEPENHARTWKVLPAGKADLLPLDDQLVLTGPPGEYTVQRVTVNKGNLKVTVHDERKLVIDPPPAPPGAPPAAPGPKP